ncbi:MAG: fumarylacetoacetate hydrolase family protein [Pseudomonadota bacterium]
MTIDARMTPELTLPDDGTAGTLTGRIWDPEAGGPCVVAIRDDGVYDLTPLRPTMSDLLADAKAGEIVRGSDARKIGDLSDILANTPEGTRHPSRAWLLAPIDLQAVKAAGVTFPRSMLERVIEEQAQGEPERAEAVRAEVLALIGGDLKDLRPGSKEAMALKEALIKQDAWSQYLEVGIGEDAEIFTKAQPMSAVGHGMAAGLHPRSTWNNPEPEVVLAVAPKGDIVGATLGNDVNLRDFEGRSALLLSKAKDNNASAAIGPFIRLFDETFSLDDLRKTTVHLEVAGEDGFRMTGTSSMSEIARDPASLVDELMGPTHQYPDGAVLYLGTMFAPTEDRGEPGMGFTHAVGDEVTISAPELGRLCNLMTTSDRAPPWTFGVGDLMRNLAGRGVLG